MLDPHEKVHYVINKSTGKRVSKFYSKRGLAENFLKKFDDQHEVVTKYCASSSEFLWIRIGRGLGGLIPRESSTYITAPGDYHCELILEDSNLNTIRLETVEIITSRYVRNDQRIHQ